MHECPRALQEVGASLGLRASLKRHAAQEVDGTTTEEHIKRRVTYETEGA